MKKMCDLDIRGPLLEKLRIQNDGHDYRIIPEMAVCDGDARIDVAVANGSLCGYEIKSDVDTLDRLVSQCESYCKTFDKVYIVVGEKYKDVIADYIPTWWGVYIAYYNHSDTVEIAEQKKARRNKAISAESLLELLWREEIETLLKAHGIKSTSGKNRRVLRKIAVDSIPLSEIRNFTRETLKTRTDWRAD